MGAFSMRPSETIQAELHAVERRAQALRIELSQAQERESRERAYAAAAGRRRRQALDAVLERLERGEWASGEGSRLWWHHDGAACVSPVTADERQELDLLASEGVVESGVVLRMMSA